VQEKTAAANTEQSAWVPTGKPIHQTDHVSHDGSPRDDSRRDGDNDDYGGGDQEPGHGSSFRRLSAAHFLVKEN
jgi:hypothetical protein